jgi:hypothetical protein
MKSEVQETHNVVNSKYEPWFDSSKVVRIYT